MNTAGISLDGKRLIELSSGTPADADRLVSHVRDHGGRCLVGMILSYPSGIGSERASITTAGDESLWTEGQGVLNALAKNLSYISADPKSLATMFSALFVTRQGYLFGMVYGALLFEKSGLPMQAYLGMLPQLNPVLEDYLDVVVKTIGSQDFSNPQASLATIQGAFEDALAPFENLEIERRMPQLMKEIVDESMDSGFGDEQMTAILKTLR